MATKPTRKGASPRMKTERNQLPGWAWLLTGLTVGLLVALLVWFHGNREAVEESIAPSPPPPPAEKATKTPPKAVEAPPPSSPRYDFYSMLPELEVVVPDATTGTGKTPPRKVEEPGEYVIQAGSFRRFEEADRLKARLALLGVAAKIQKVTVNDDTWHRVRIGPYRDLGELNRVRDRLHENEIQTMLMKAPKG